MGSEPLTWGRVVTAWTLEPWVLAVVVAAAVLYLLGVRRVSVVPAGPGGSAGSAGPVSAGSAGSGGGGGSVWPVNRTVLFIAGLALWLLSVSSFMGTYERVLFTDRAVQTVLLLMVVPLLIALGAPVSLLAAALPPGPSARLRRMLAGRMSKLLMFPAVSSALLIAPPWLFFFTPVYDAALRDSAANIGLHFALVLLGLGYFWPRLQLDPVGHEYPHLMGVFITFAEVIFDGALGIILIFGGHLVGGHHYAALHRTWGPSLRQDQIWGGGAFWVLGDAAGLPFLAALVVRMIRQDRQSQVEIDRELDVQFAAEKAAAGIPDDDAEPEMMRPWWETEDVPHLRRRLGRSE